MEEQLLVNSYLNKIVDSILEYIYDRRDPNKKVSSLGLYDGEFGIFLFLTLYNNKFPSTRIESILDQFLEDLIQDWTDRPDNYTYCSGTAGILDMFSYLDEHDMCKIDLSEIVQPLNNYIAIRMQNDMKVGNYDFLHGALGPASYFLYNNVKLDSVSEFVNLLDKSAYKDDNEYKWDFFDIIDKRKKINISLSHGMSSILIFLSNAYKQNVNNDLIYKMLCGCSNFIQKQKFETVSKNLSMFPSYSKEEGCNDGRLAWCYGDLGIAVALWKMWSCTSDSEYKNSALKIVENSFQRRDIIINMVSDPYLCHGTAGIALLYQYFYDEMNLDDCLAARNYWLRKTLKMLPSDDKIIINTKTYPDDINLLTGMAGVGLILLSSITHDYSWRRLFMLS